MIGARWLEHLIECQGCQYSVSKGVATIEATEAAASVINSASYILKYTTTLTEPRAYHDKFVCWLSTRTFTV